MQLKHVVLLAVVAHAKLAPPNAIKHAPKAVAVQQRGGAAATGGMSETAATVSLFKTIVGGGILALPAGMAAGAGTGLGPGLAILALHALLSAYTYSLVGRTVGATGAKSFSDLWARAFSPESSWIIDAIVVGVAGGACLTYSCFLGDLLHQLVPGLSRTAAIAALTVCPIAPLALLKDLSALKSSSLVGLAAVAVSALVVVKRFVDGSYGAGEAFGGWLEKAPGAPLSQVSLSAFGAGSAVLFNMLSTAFMCHTNAVRAYHELRDKRRHGAVAVKAFGLAALLYGAVMLAGYGTFGGACEGLILANYDQADPGARLAWVATLVSLLCSHPLLFTSFRDASFSLLGRSDVPGSSSWVMASLGLLAVPTGLAVVLPDVGFVVSLMGSSLGAALILIVPSLMGKALLPGAEAGFMSGCAAFGVLIGVFGTAVTFLESYTDLLK